MLKKLFYYFKNKKKSELSVIISLKSDQNIDIKINYPDFDNTDITAIPDIAEKYAELIVYIGSNILKYKLLSFIQDKSYKTEDMKEKLFFDNLISFYEIITKQIKNNQNSGPLIRPISVFNTK